jgi:hypothetical protein
VKIVLFVEGETEAKCLPPLVRRWLDRCCTDRVGVTAVKFDGWADYTDHIQRKVEFHLGPNRAPDLLGGIGVLDLYGPTFYPPNVVGANDRKLWAKTMLEQKVGNPLFRQHMAVHELEAWLLSHPDIFPRDIATAIRNKVVNPETVNFNTPPAKFLDKLYWEKARRTYRKIIDGSHLFAQLDLDVPRRECASLRQLLDDAVALACPAAVPALRQ